MRLVRITICLIAGAVWLLAQSAAGSIAGTVSDRLGHKVASAQIEARNMTTGAVYRTVSDEQGAYTLSLPSGTYAISTVVVGHRSTQEGVVITPERPLRGIDVVLAIP
jgi:hypothetical protein